MVGVLAGRGIAQETAQEPRVLRFPHEATAWDATSDVQGRVHVVFAVRAKGSEPELSYVVSAADRSEWGDPVRVPTEEWPVTLGGRERGPGVALVDGAVLVSWQSRDRIALVRSEDGGKSWERVRVRDADVEGGIDMLAMTSGPGGRVALVWNDSRGHGSYGEKFATGLFMAESRDGGRTFAANVQVNRDGPGACPCCEPDAMYDEAGHLWIAYRSSGADLKEITVAKLGAEGKPEFRTISEDKWRFVGCPMSGPHLAVSGDGARVAVVWNKEKTMQAATAEGGAWSQPRRLGTGAWHDAGRIGGRLVLMWDEGERTGLAPAEALGAPVRVDVAPSAVLLDAAEGPPVLVAPRQK